MKLWDLKISSSASVSAMFADEEFWLRGQMRGINPNAVRATLAAVPGAPVFMKLVDVDGNQVDFSADNVPDIVFWTWLPIFSERAKQLFLAHGANEADFWLCEFEKIRSAQFYLHVPTESYDILDMEHSKFRMIIPMDPPLPHLLELAKLRPDIPDLPPCFRVAIPGHLQVLSELVVTDELKVDWEKTGLSGGEFRRLT